MWKPVSRNKIWKIEGKAETNEQCYSSFWFRLSIFRIPWSRSRNFETNVVLEILCIFGERSLRCLIVHALSFRDLVLLFFFFFFDLRLVNFEIRFKFQRKFRRRKAKEVRQTVTKRTATNGFSFFGFCLGPKNEKSLLLLCHYTRLVICRYIVQLICMLIHYLHPIFINLAIN